jgi:hypothetical protein
LNRVTLPCIVVPDRLLRFFGTDSNCFAEKVDEMIMTRFKTGIPSTINQSVDQSIYASKPLRKYRQGRFTTACYTGVQPPCLYCRLWGH